MSHHAFSPASGTSFRPSPDPDFDLQTRLYATKALPDPPLRSVGPQNGKEVKSKPGQPDALLVETTMALEQMTGQKKQDTVPAQQPDEFPAQTHPLGEGTANTDCAVASPTSPLRCAMSTASSPTVASRRRSSAKVHQLTGLDIHVYDNQAPCNPGAFLLEESSDDSSGSVYSQDSTHNTSTTKSWHTTTDDIPPLDMDHDASSSRVQSWEPQSPPAAAPTLQPTPSLARKQRTKRRSRDQHVLDNYHRIVTDLAGPSSSTTDLSTPVPPPKSPFRTVRPLQEREPLQVHDGMPADFDVMCNDPRQAPRPPPQVRGPDGERLTSYFDDSDSNDESAGIFTTNGRARDSFLGMLLGRGFLDDGNQGNNNNNDSSDQHQRSHKPRSRSPSVSTAGGGRPSSELDFSFVDPGPPLAADTPKRAKSGSKRAALKGLVEEWTRKDSSGSEAEQAARRRQDLKSKIIIQGGRRM